MWGPHPNPGNGGGPLPSGHPATWMWGPHPNPGNGGGPLPSGHPATWMWGPHPNPGHSRRGELYGQSVNDLRYGAFSDLGPWEVDPDHLAWRPGLDHVRRAVRAEVPLLVRPRLLPPGRRLAATARHLGLAVAAWRMGKKRLQGREASIADLSLRLRRAAER